jgi:hypothetical protein
MTQDWGWPHTLLQLTGEERNQKSWDVRRLLTQIRTSNWGFVLYRTVYTPESDILWPDITKKLDAYMHKSIWECNPNVDAYELDPEPNRQACALLKNEIMDDKAKFDGATIKEIMNHYVDLMGYRDWNELPDPMAPKISPFCRAHPHINRHMCLLIDQEGLEAVRDAPTPLPKTDEPVLYIKAVDSHFGPQWDEYPPEYTGWAFVNARSLWYLHQDLGGDSLLGDRMHERWGADFDGKVFRYTAEYPSD